MQTNNKEIVIKAIRDGLNCFYGLAKLNLRRGKDFKNMSRAQKLLVGRALVMMHDVAEMPDRHLGRAATEGQWRARAAKYAQSHGIDERSAYYIVPSPLDVLCDKTDMAFVKNYELRVAFYNFCDYVKDWYYSGRDSDANEIIARSKEVQNKYKAGALHSINKFLPSFVKQH